MNWTWKPLPPEIKRFFDDWIYRNWYPILFEQAYELEPEIFEC
jgi:hypothetical protein